MNARQITCSIVLLLVVAAAASSAPIVPSGPNLAHDVLSLAGISKVALDVEEMTPLLRAAGLSAGKVKLAWSKALQGAGIEVVDDDVDVPRLHLRTKASVEEGLTGIGFASYLQVWQPVRIERLDRKLKVPTYVYVMGGVDSAENIASTANKSFRILINGFIERVRIASKAVDS
ncbi:MAG: hypothetical protein CMJ18_19090 [Phycisphaeraceae bacterium]|nr:hypothetical protein [Phycisphaeraceae bacterium]